VLLGEPTARRFTDVELTRYMNEGVNEIFTKTLCFQSTSTFQIKQNQYEYTTAAVGLTACIGIRAVIFLDSTAAATVGTGARALLKMHPRHFTNIGLETAASPLEYAWTHSAFFIWPKPILAQEDDLVKIFYYKSITAVTAQDLVLLNIIYGPYVVWYAYACALRKLGKHAQAQQYFSYFYNIINYHAQDIQADYNNVDSEDMMNLPDYVEFA